MVSVPRGQAGGQATASRGDGRSELGTKTSNSAMFKLGEPPALGPSGALHSCRQLPINERRAPALDFAKINTKDKEISSVRTPRKGRKFGLEDALTYRPTAEEFSDPLDYIQKIGPKASAYGIVKIIPPADWNPAFAIDTERFHFKTRKQELNSVEGITRVNLSYLDQLARFHKMQGTSLNRFPSVDKKPLDLHRLKKAVEMRGGFERVCKHKKWAEIGRDLGYSGKIMSSLSTSLKNSYGRWLQPFEEYLRVNKPGFAQNWELESGSPIPKSAHTSFPQWSDNSLRRSSANGHVSPSNRTSVFGPQPIDSAVSPSLGHGPNTTTPKGSTPINTIVRRESSSVNTIVPKPSNPINTIVPRAGPALNTIVPKASPPLNSNIPKESSSLNTLVPRGSGFTPVNPGGFTAINSTSGFTAINGHTSPHSIDKLKPPFRGENQYPLPPTSTSNGYASPTLSDGRSKRPRSSGEATPLKALAPSDADQHGSNERRSKRLRRDQPATIAGSNMSVHRVDPAKRRLLTTKHMPGAQCDTCGNDNDLDNTLACESCDGVYHKECLGQQMPIKPEEWTCAKCLVGTGEFGFEDGGMYSLSSFQAKANEFKRQHFKLDEPSKLNPNPDNLSESEVEAEFWRLVESLEETVTVEYGADLHSTTHGSAFPTKELQPRNPYSHDPWNLNNLPFLDGSLFKYINNDISGMTNPWSYVGMCFSTFCWHTEDHNTYSANYHHFGDTKTWYGVPGEDFEKFEAAMKRAVPDLFERQPDLLYHLTTLLSPEQLKANGVRVYAIDQHAGELVVTFPRAFHAGFNHGFNFNEAVNFAPPDWESYGRMGVDRLQEFRKAPCFSHDELLLMAMGQETSLKTLRWLSTALQLLQQREAGVRMRYFNAHRASIVRLGITCSHINASCLNKCPHTHKLMTDEDKKNPDLTCTFCKAYCYMSFVYCTDSKKRYCLDHVEKAEGENCCGTTEPRVEGRHQVWYRVEQEDLASQVDRILEKARAPEAWQAKYDKVLDEGPSPSLKVMKSLAVEGEKIPYPLAHFSELKQFVERCTEWVEEATYYITRKQLSRKKTEKPLRRSSIRNAEAEEREKQLRDLENIPRLLREAEKISFECPEISLLQEKLADIEDWQHRAQELVASPSLTSVQELIDIAEIGRSFTVDLPEVEELEALAKVLGWRAKVGTAKATQPPNQAVYKDLAQEGKDLGVVETDGHLAGLTEQLNSAKVWEERATELLAAEVTNFPQLQALASQSEFLPVITQLRDAVRDIIGKQQEAENKIKRYHDQMLLPEHSLKPFYKDVREAVDSMVKMQRKPPFYAELEKELKRHEDWMRRGKKLFGKANAPLHILQQHMDYVDARNRSCFSLEDVPRAPVEPPSREASPTGSEHDQFTMDSEGDRIYCLCRTKEAGMMVECESCRCWYHGKCLKIARGKVKENDKFMCPICDYRVKIPRDAARPRLSELLEWQEDIETLPFQAEEEACLTSIIDTASTFQNHITPYLNPIMSFTNAEITELRHFLRKLEGADVHLANESNYFKQEIHKLAPVAPEPPPVMEKSLSTRKPRPTKMQKLMIQYKVSDPMDLPPEHRPTKKDVFAKDPLGTRIPKIFPKGTPGCPRERVEGPKVPKAGSPRAAGPLYAYPASAAHYPSGTSEVAISRGSPITPSQSTDTHHDHGRSFTQATSYAETPINHSSLLEGMPAISMDSSTGPQINRFNETTESEPEVDADGYQYRSRSIYDAEEDEDSEKIDEMFADFTAEGDYEENGEDFGDPMDTTAG